MIILRQNFISYPADKVYKVVEVRPPLPASTLKCTHLLQLSSYSETVRTFNANVFALLRTFESSAFTFT